jgi:hypothetical protein
MIEPGIGTETFKLGTHFDDVDLSTFEITEVEDRDILKVYKTKNIWFFFNSSDSTLDQLSLFSPFEEKVLGKVGLGDCLSDVYDTFGECCINNKVHEPLKYNGIAFEIEGSSKNAKISCISVSVPFQFYGELPKHIKANSPGKKRKLP